MLKFITLVIHGYQKVSKSGLFHVIGCTPPSCRYLPTCSRYAEEAFSRYGMGRGALRAARRLLRCHPFSTGGWDPVI